MKDRIYITEADMERLRRIIDDRIPPTAEDRVNQQRLEEELDRAEVVDVASLPANVIAMHSDVRLQDLDTNQTKEYRLVFPGERVPGKECISILAPLGTALIGYRKGSTISWPVPKGARRLKVLEVKQERPAAAVA